MEINRTYIEDLYFKQNLTYDQIAEIIGCCKSTVGNIIRSNPNYKKKSQSLYTSPFLDENYFEVIDTEAKAYLLGLFITDGNVGCYGGSYQIRLQLQSSDVYILEFLKNQIHCNNNLIVDKRDGSMTFSLKSEKMFYDLSKYGIVPNKTLNNFIPQGIHPLLMPHLIRGIIDGDGWISKSYDKYGKKHIAVGICGNECFIYQIQDILAINAMVNRNIINTYSDINSIPIYQTMWCSMGDIIRLYAYLYTGANVYLLRKYRKIVDIILYENTERA